MTVNARVQKHRAKLREEDCRRLEVCIGIAVIEDVREIAKHKKVSMWEVVQEALESYLAAYSGVLEVIKKYHNGNSTGI